MQPDGTESPLVYLRKGHHQEQEVDAHDRGHRLVCFLALHYEAGNQGSEYSDQEE